MKSIKSMLSSPKRIALFAVCAVLIIGVIAFSILYAVGSIANNQGIGLEKATNVALQNAGYSEAEVKGLKGHYDREDNLEVYEVEFYAGGFEYDYTIAADDGTILEANRELTNEITGSDSQQPSDNSQSQTPEEDADSKDDSQAQDSQQSQQGQQPSDTSQYIGTEKAKELALTHSGVSSSSAVFTKTKLDRDDGVYVYEIEFQADTMEYAYEIDASTGNILSFDKESIYD